MGAHTLLQRRKYSYVIRKRVPADLVPVLGKREIVKSLGTLNVEEAKRRVRAKANEIDRVFAEARQPADLTPEQVTQLVNQWLAAALTEDAEAREEGEFPMRDDTPAMSDWAADAARGQLATTNPQTVDFEADALLQSSGIPNVTPQARRRLSMALLRASVVLHERTAERNRGVWREDAAGFVPPPPVHSIHPTRPNTAADATADNPRLSEVFDRWASERKPPPKTLSEWRTSMRRFREVIGEDIPIRSITRAHVREFRAAITRLPFRMKADLAKLTVPEIIAKVSEENYIVDCSPRPLYDGRRRRALWPI